MSRFTKKELIELATKETGLNFNCLGNNTIDFFLEVSDFEDDYSREEVSSLIIKLKRKAEIMKHETRTLFNEPILTEPYNEAPRRVNKTITFESRDSLLREWELRSILTAQELETEASSWRAEYLSSEPVLSEKEAITWIEEQEQKQRLSSKRFDWLQVNIFTEKRTCIMAKVYAAESSLRSLAIRAADLQDKTEWKESEAVRFILLGHIPFIQPIEVSTSWSIPSRRAFITLKVDHSVQPQEVAAYYKKAVQEFSAKRTKTNGIKEALKKGRNKMKEDKDLPRFEKLIQETPGKTSAERATIWNKKYPGDPITRHKFEKMAKKYMQIMNPTKSRFRSLDEKTLTLARFLLATPDKKGSERVKEWKKYYPNYKIADDNVNIFSVALHRAKKKFSSSF